MNNDGLMNPNFQRNSKPQTKTVSVKNDGLMEREDDKVLTQDGRELLKEKK